MKVIFLDIDGVVNTLKIYKTPPRRLKRYLIYKDNFYFDMPNKGRVSNLDAITWLELICRQHNASIVISSTWRIDFQGVIDALRNAGLSKDIQIIGRTGAVRNSRGEEIQEYLDKHPEITEYIIIDDDSDMGNLTSHLVQTNTWAGITMKTLIDCSNIDWRR